MSWFMKWKNYRFLFNEHLMEDVLLYLCAPEPKTLFGRSVIFLWHAWEHVTIFFEDNGQMAHFRKKVV